jgi:hypothetical protein
MATIRKHTATWTTKDGEHKTKVRWRAVYTDRAGDEHVKHFDRKTEAQDWIDDQTAGLVRSDWVNPQLGKQSFRAYAEAWRARQIHAESTPETFEIVLNSHIYPKIGDWRIDSVRSPMSRSSSRRGPQPRRRPLCICATRCSPSS